MKTTMTGCLAVSLWIVCIVCILCASVSSAIHVCEAHEVHALHREACHLRPQKRNVGPTMRMDGERQPASPDQAHVYPGFNVASYLQRLMQFRGKRSLLTPEQLREMRNRCCIHGCTADDFLRFACVPD